MSLTHWHRSRNHYAKSLACTAIFAIAALLAVQQSAYADHLAEIQKRGVLRWGADQEGGGPFVYPRNDNPDEVTGFEVEVAKRLAEHLHVKAEFVQSNWNQLPEMLATGKIDIILNGFELTAPRSASMDSTVPYYIYRLQLLSKKGDQGRFSWFPSGNPPSGRIAKVGVLAGSAAESFVRKVCEDPKPRACQVIGYDGNTDAMREVETGKLDAALEDSPIAAFYAPRFPTLAPVGAPVEKGYYVIYVQKGEASLVKALNEGLIALARSGTLENIYRKYGIWDDTQHRLLDIAESSRFYGYGNEPIAASNRSGDSYQPPLDTAIRDRGWTVVKKYGFTLLESAGMTVLLSVVSFPLAIALGLMVAIGRLYGPRWLKLPLAAYVEFLRGTPLMLQLYFVFFFLPEIGIRIPAFWTGILGLSINYSAYESEIYRAGLQAIPRGQMEAAASLGMSRWLALRRILVPQAVRLVIPPVVSDFIALYKDTSVCSVITIVELTKRFSVLSMSTQATVELILMTGALYLLMSYPVALLTRRWENKDLALV